MAVGPLGRTGAGNVSVAAEGVAHAYSCEWSEMRELCITILFDSWRSHTRLNTVYVRHSLVR